MPLLNNLQYQRCPEIIRRFEMRCIIFRLDLYNLKTRNKLEVYIIVRIELSINENTERPET